MSENLNEKYKKIIDFLYNVSASYCDELGIQIEIEIPKDDKLNASVRYVKDNIYHINIFPRCLNLDYIIQDITKRYTADDLQFFWRFKNLSVFERFEEDTYREDLNNLFATIILLHIFYHECGHIYANHVDVSGNMYVEYDSTRIGSYEIQEREMVADWLSTNNVIQWMFCSIVSYDNFDPKEILSIFKHIIIFYWLSLTIEFQIFDSNHMDMERIDDLSKLTHPLPAVRLFYSIEAMRESMANILTRYGFDDNQSEMGVNTIIKDVYMWIESFLGITNAPIDIMKNKPKITDHYIKLRDISYENEAKENTYYHLMPLPDEYRKTYEEYRISQEI